MVFINSKCIFLQAISVLDCKGVPTTGLVDQLIPLIFFLEGSIPLNIIKKIEKEYECLI